MIVLLTDFGVRDPYIGQMQAAICREAPYTDVINLFPELPAFAVQESAYLLASYQEYFPENTVFLCVVDPGVGSEREPVIIRAQDKWFVGPDNGLFDVIKMRTRLFQQWRIDYYPEHCSDSFHGRDIFAPVAAMLKRGEMPESTLMTPTLSTRDWPEELQRIIYCDHYGNAMTGIRSSAVNDADRFEVSGKELGYARIFAEAGSQPFWYRNSNGLVEFALNQGSVVSHLQLKVGDEFLWIAGN
jgi:S-adenosylmethionine hydrolase